MIKTSCNTGQKGYTLIELLLYMTILGSLLMGISLYFVTSTTARVKNQTVAEVDRQGALAMDYITQTIRNADSVTSPAAGMSSGVLTLAVPNALISPTIFSLSSTGGGDAILGYDQDGGFDDTSNVGGVIRATKFVASTSGTITTMHALIGLTVGGPANNKAQMALYSGATPTTLLANSNSIILSPFTWNTFTISPVAITAGQTYWLAYNTNASNSFENALRFHAGSTGQSRTQVQAYNDWPASFTGLSQNVEYSMYADVVTGEGGGSGGVSAIQVKEGIGSAVPLVNDKVQVSELTFTNLSRPGTPGVVRVSFVVSRVNPNNRNEYSYQKTFTGTAALRP